MVSISILALASFLFSLLLTPLLRDFALKRGWLDIPDEDRKTHATPCPRLGGVPILAACTAAFGILWIAEARASAVPRTVWEAAGAVGLMFAVGLLDDFFTLEPWQKLGGEIAAAVVMFHSGIRIEHLGPALVPVPLRAVATVVWLVGCTNAFNLIDGADGLAGGLALIASLAVFTAGMVHGDTLPTFAAAALIGALAGFLRFNFHRASIFLGDCGSLLAGFVLAACGVVWSQHATSLIAVTAPAIAFAVPLFDTAISILRRFLRRQPIFSGDRDHIHHRLLDRGFTATRLVGALYCMGALAAVLALIETTAGPLGRASALAAFAALLYAAIQYLRYREFGLAARALRQNGVRATVRSHLTLGRCEEALRDALSAEECWQVIRSVGRDLGFSDVALCLGGHIYRDRPMGRPDGHWTLHIPLAGPDYLRFMYPLGSPKPPAIVAPLADALHRTLTAKAGEFAPQPEEIRARAARILAKRRMRMRAIAALAAASDHGEAEAFVPQKHS
ncbi:MAG: undecaprenyl/decaprenyl-phosphate alpha-N-acetylglucosaminyl 1-phosphate transferase [Acidobacteriia bacterium]|nr:undecaprenyl/decaprenyl-phosphate alpha-N-acetylglucosaminyl 1-phosphate transferase [Terriglobia bacterium]